MSIQEEAEAVLSKPLEVSETITVKTADKLDNSPVEWLIPQWIPKRGIVLLGADGGTGKTFVWISILSSLSKGESTFLRYDPDTTEKTVLCISGEDAENILRSRLEKAGAKLKNVLCIAQDTETEEITFGSEFLEKIIEKYRPAIVVFDPLQSFIGSNVDMSRRNQMRQSLKPLAVLSSKYDMPVLIVMHTNKRDADGRNKLADSSDIWDIARAVLMCGFTEDKERYISLEKSSYTDHIAVPTILFNLEGGRVHFAGTSDKKMADYVAEKKAHTASEEPRPTLKAQCCNAILNILADHTDGMDANELKAELIDSGYKDKTIRNAKEELIRSEFIKHSKQKDGSVVYFRTSK